MFLPAILIQLFLFFSAPPPGQPGSAKIDYQSQILILATKDSVAAIAFEDEFKDGVSYRYRLLPNQKPEETGQGKVFEKYKRLLDADGNPTGQVIDEGGQLSIHAGPISVGWSLAGLHKGWIYYERADIQVHLLDAQDLQTLDLKKFLPRE